ADWHVLANFEEAAAKADVSFPLGTQDAGGCPFSDRHFGSGSGRAGIGGSAARTNRIATERRRRGAGCRPTGGVSLTAWNSAGRETGSFSWASIEEEEPG